jgi:aminotransferase
MDFNSMITNRLRAIDASGIRKVFDLAAKIEEPINLSIGQPDFDVPEAIKEAAIAAIRAGHNKYTQTQGIAELRERVLGDFKRDYGNSGRWGEAGVLITSGVSGGLVLAMMSMVEAGDEVLVPDPYFVISS